MSGYRIASPDYVPSHDEIDALLAFLPIFARPDFVPAVSAGTPPGWLPSDVWAPELEQFHQAAYECGFMMSFDWVSWQDTAERYFNSPELLDDADMSCLRKLITVHVRKERFCEGHLPAMVQAGHIAAILRRLRVIRVRESQVG